MTSTVASRLLDATLELFEVKFDTRVKAIAVSDPYYTELLMAGLRDSDITPSSYLFIGRGVRWNNIPIVYSNDPGIQVITVEAAETMAKVEEYLKTRSNDLDGVIADIAARESGSPKATGIHLEMFA